MSFFLFFGFQELEQFSSGARRFFWFLGVASASGIAGYVSKIDGFKSSRATDSCRWSGR